MVLTQTDEIQSAEYVLGLADDAAIARADGRMRTDPVFAGAVRRWEDDFGGLLIGPADHVAPAHVLEAVRARLFGRPADPVAPGFPWGRLIGAIVAAKVVAVGAVLGWNAWWTTTIDIATPYGPAELAWHARQGRIRLDHAGPQTLQIWVETDGGLRYLGAEGGWIRAGLSAGDTLVLGEGRPASPEGPTSRVVLGTAN